MSRSTQQFGVLYRWKNWRVREQRSAKALPLPKRGHGGAILRVGAALGRRVVSQPVRFTTRGLFCGAKSGLPKTVSPGCESQVCFILGDWREIHSTPEDKGLCLQNVPFFFFWNCKGSGTRNGFRYIMLRSNPVILSQLKIHYRSILSIHIFLMCFRRFT